MNSSNCQPGWDTFLEICCDGSEHHWRNFSVTTATYNYRPFTVSSRWFPLVPTSHDHSAPWKPVETCGSCGKPSVPFSWWLLPSTLREFNMTTTAAAIGPRYPTEYRLVLDWFDGQLPRLDLFWSSKVVVFWVCVCVCVCLFLLFGGFIFNRCWLHVLIHCQYIYIYIHIYNDM